MERNNMRKNLGFTLVEMLIVIPIVMIVIGGVITAIIGMTGDILSSRAADTLTYSIQDSLTQIRQDVEQSNGFLATDDFTPTSPQGSDGSTAAFTNVGGESPVLILKSTATTANPNLLTSSTIYLANQPNACGSANIAQNQALSVNIVYFVHNNSLWRRVVVPSNYQTAGCSVPWQLASCFPGNNSAICKSDDADLVDADSINFGLQYYDGANDMTADPTAVDTTASTSARNTALQDTDTVGITITATKQVSGRAINQTISARATRPSVSTASVTVPGSTSIPPAPTISGSFSPNSGVTFTWQPVSLAATYTVSWQRNGGSWTQATTGSSDTTFTLPDYVRNDVVTVKVVASTAAGSSGNSTASVTIPAWNPLPYQGLYFDGGSAYSTGAYAMTSDGAVIFEGVITNPQNPSAGTVISVLPPAYRPAYRYIFQTITATNQPTRIDVDTSGNILYELGATSANQSLTLNGIAYIVVPSAAASYAPQYTLNTLTPLINGWTNVGSPYASASYYTDNDNRVWINGVVKGGTLSNGATIVSVPNALSPPGSLFFPESDSNAFGEYGLYTYPGVATKDSYYGGTATSLSLQSMYYPYGIGTWTTATVQNSWVSYNAPGYPAAKYTKGSDGMVSLIGMLKGGTTTAGTVLLTLPAGYRPAHELMFEELTNNKSVRIDILANGNVVLEQAADATWVTLNNLKFMAEQ